MRHLLLRAKERQGLEASQHAWRYISSYRNLQMLRTCSCNESTEHKSNVHIQSHLPSSCFIERFSTYQSTDYCVQTEQCQVEILRGNCGFSILGPDHILVSQANWSCCFCSDSQRSTTRTARVQDALTVTHQGWICQPFPCQQMLRISFSLGSFCPSTLDANIVSWGLL